MTKEKVTLESSDGVLVKAAKTIGTAAGKIAAAVGVAPPATPARPAKTKLAKLAKSNKTRLPRRQKKAVRKAAKSA